MIEFETSPAAYACESSTAGPDAQGLGVRHLVPRTPS